MDPKMIQKMLGDTQAEIALLLTASSTASNEKLEKAMSRFAELSTELATTRATVDGLEKQLGRANGAFGNGAVAPKTIGEAFVESESFKNFKPGQDRNSRAFRVEGGFKGVLVGGHRVKDVLQGLPVGSNGYALTEPMLLQTPFRSSARFRTPRLRDVLPRNTLNTNALEWIKQTRFAFAYAEVRTGIAAGGPVTIQMKTAADDGSQFAGVSGFKVGAAIYFKEGEVGEHDAVITAVDVAAGTLEVGTLGTAVVAGDAVST